MDKMEVQQYAGRTHGLACIFADKHELRGTN